MIKRPKRDETEEDILRMQQQFLEERAKNPKLQPAAQIVKIEKAPKKSLFAQSRQKLAESAACSSVETAANAVVDIGSNPTAKGLLDEIHSKIMGNLSGDIATQLSISDIVMGDIVAKDYTAPKSFEAPATATAFPTAERSAFRNASSSDKSIFAHDAERKRVHDIEPMLSEPIEKRALDDIYGSSSAIIEDTCTGAEVHQESMEILRQMREEEILEERRKLLESIDPSLVALLAKKRQQKMCSTAQIPTPYLKDVAEVPADETATESNTLAPSNAAVEIIERSVAEKWLNFDHVESHKLEWLRDITTQTATLKAGEKFEARFDWKGVLLPYSTSKESMDTTDAAAATSATKTTTSETIAEPDERELYMHGDEPHRPGYTLQELFRLARSNVMQQRIAAFGAIAGILNIYNQGFYDNVLELPITKIFFLLRYGLDDNAPAMLEIVSRAVAYLFYNETDETLLDFVFDNPGCHWQPTLQLGDHETDSEDPTSIENLQKQMQQLQMNAAASKGAAIKAPVDETEAESKTTMSDFQLAETDLIECLVRSNILQRIYFILNNVRPDNSTVSSCLKLLIRIARSGPIMAAKIANNAELMQCLFDNFLPGMERVDTTLVPAPFYAYPQHLCLKLLRILITQNLSIALKFIDQDLEDKLQNYLYNREDIKDTLIKVQIESLRIVRCLLMLRVDNALYKKFLSAFRYMLEWHLHHVIYEVGGPYLIRQHAAALLAAISSGNCNLEVATTLGDALNDCCCSWFYKASKSGVTEFSQATLLSACLNAVTWYTRNSDLERFRSFKEKYLRDFLRSTGFVHFVKTLHSSSIVLRVAHDRRNIHSALPNVGSVLQHHDGTQLVVPQTYCVYLLGALWRLLELHLLHNERTLIDLLIQPQIVEPIVEYMKALATHTNRHLATNFYAKAELRMIYMFLCFDGFAAYFDKSQMLQIVYNIVCCLTAEHIIEIEQLFSNIIFNSDYIEADAEVLKKWRKTCLDELIYPHYIIVSPTELSLSMPCSQTPILARDWPYFQLKIILQNYLENVQQKPAAIFSEREVIHMTFTFVSLLEARNPQLHIVTPTEQLMYMMIAFMGPDAQFLDAAMNDLLRNHLLHFYAQCKDYTFDFDAIYEGKCKFENLYALFVDHFQAASYGNELFGSLVLLPMAQKYDNKWRRRLWSDYAAALRFLDCDESLLIGGLKAYLEPAEDEESLVKAYAMALQTQLVRIGTVPHKIALHHVERFKEHLNKK